MVLTRACQSNFTVLYSCQQGAWQIADFGLTSEGTSKNVRDTNHGRGTTSYRAPELINTLQYNNKVDIWAIGCVLFEVIFRKKAFLSDGAVQQYGLEYRSGKR